MNFENQLPVGRPAGHTSIPSGIDHLQNGPPVDLSTPKRKRGRPPKASSLTNQITTRLNININTSPLSSSPTAESNSNLIVKQGAPDCFTPLMRVSPTSRKRKRKSSTSTTSETPSSLKRSRDSGFLVTPLSSAVNGPAFTPQSINARTLDNLSYVTQSETVYSTPPSSTMKGQANAYIGYQDSNTSSHFSVKGARKINSMVDPTFLLPEGNSRTDFMKVGNQSNNAEKNLLPPVPIATLSPSVHEDKSEKNDNNATHIQDKHVEKESQSDSMKDFSLSLMIDESGKAVLSSNMNRNGNNSFAENDTHTESNRELESESSVSKHSSYSSGHEINLHEDHKQTPATLESGSIQQHQHDANMVSQQPSLRRHRSDVTGISSHSLSKEESFQDKSDDSYASKPPQTPKFKENYLYAANGLTPSNALTFNLTPQFNSLMYSMMNINSPQSKRSANNQQFLLNQDLFVNGNQLNHDQSTPIANSTTINMTDLIALGESTASYNKISQRPVITSQATGIGPLSTNGLNNDDSGDARSALKKIIYVKKK